MDAGMVHVTIGIKRERVLTPLLCLGMFFSLLRKIHVPVPREITLAITWIR